MPAYPCVWLYAGQGPPQNNATYICRSITMHQFIYKHTDVNGECVYNHDLPPFCVALPVSAIYLSPCLTSILIYKHNWSKLFLIHTYHEIHKCYILSNTNFYLFESIIIYFQFQELVISIFLIFLFLLWEELQDTRVGILQVMCPESNPSLIIRDLRPKQ